MEVIRSIGFSAGEMVSTIKLWAERHGNIYNNLKLRDDVEDSKKDYYRDNPNYGAVSAAALISVIKDIKPKRIVEIGSGFSSRLISQLIKEQDEKCEYTIIDPNYHEIIDNANIRKEKFEDISDLDCITRLGRNDILFIDSSHISLWGSDVCKIFMEILPKIKSGVYIHFHDIFLPEDYPKFWWTVKDRRMWNEQYMLYAFLFENKKFKTLFAAHFLHLNVKEEMKKSFAFYEEDNKYGAGSSLWMVRV